MSSFIRNTRRRARRRGSALMLTVVLTFVLGAIAISSIYMSAGTGMLSKLYDRERDYRYAAEWALAVGKSRVSVDTTLTLPDSLYLQLMNGDVVRDAAGNPLPRVKVDLYAGVGGASTGQYGRYVELVAVAYDNGGARHVRRLELQAENFARFAMFVDTWTPGSYTTGEIIRGRAHSNQGWSSAGSPGPIYTDTVSAVGTVAGAAQYQSAKMSGVSRINFPTVSKLSFMPGYAAAAGLSFAANAPVAGKGGTRVEFVAVDLNGNGLLTGPAEGYFRIFDANAATDTSELRASWPGGTTTVSTALSTALWKKVITNQCGLHYVMDLQGSGVPNDTIFLPIAAHDTTKPRYKWVDDSLRA
ncbi:MAG TPA: hypothetical protein VFV33_11060, partial [Gemmatimonadaceae bacterium]|nr:hypothetical protein [Gemmatimonadaceae bacterium]